MKTTLHKSGSRGHANHGWLDTYHTFSFADYHNPDRVHFGAIRVLNDDTVAGGRGFGAHPHSNMEIISIPLKGALEHQDSTGHQQVIKEGEVQIMSAGSGIQHSEHNHDPALPVNFLQIWILPEKQNIEPRYEQKRFDLKEVKNEFVNVLAPDNPNALWINQQAWLYLGEFEKDKQQQYTLRSAENGIYVFMIEGEMEVGDTYLQRRDGLEISGTTEVNLKITEDAKILFVETILAI